MFVDRDPDRDVKHLRWRVRFFGAGAVLGVLGMATETSWMVWTAIAVLGVGFALRFLPAPEEDGSGG